MEIFIISIVAFLVAILTFFSGFGLGTILTPVMMLFFPVPIKAKYFISFYILMEVYLGVSMSRGDNVAHFAHLGGALFGYILVKVWNKNRYTLY